MSDRPPKKRAKAKRPALSLAEIRFCTHYAEHGNASEAFRTAFPKRAAESVRVLAFRLLRKPAVQSYVYDLRGQACDMAQATVSKIAQGLSRCAFADRRQLYDTKGCILLPHQWPEDVAATVEATDSEQLFERVTETDPESKKQVRKKVLKGHMVKVRTTRRVDALKVLAAWRSMVLDAQSQAFMQEIAMLREKLAELKKGDAT